MTALPGELRTFSGLPVRRSTALPVGEVVAIAGMGVVFGDAPRYRSRHTEQVRRDAIHDACAIVRVGLEPLVGSEIAYGPDFLLRTMLQPSMKAP